MAIDYVNSSKEATNGQGWTKVAGYQSIGTEVVKGGVKFKIVACEEHKTSLMKRVGIFALTCLTLGLALINQSMRNVILGKEITEFAVPAAVLMHERKDADINKLETLKENVRTNYPTVADKVIKAVAISGLIGAAAGGAVTYVIGEAYKYFVPILAADIAKSHFGYNGMIASGAIFGAIFDAAICLHFTRTVSKIETMKIVAVPTVFGAVAISSIALVSRPTLVVAAVVASVFTGSVMTAQTIFNHFASKCNARIAEIDKKIAVISA